MQFIVQSVTGLLPARGSENVNLRLCVNICAHNTVVLELYLWSCASRIVSSFSIYNCKSCSLWITTLMCWTCPDTMTTRLSLSTQTSLDNFHPITSTSQQAKKILSNLQLHFNVITGLTIRFIQFSTVTVYENYFTNMLKQIPTKQYSVLAILTSYTFYDNVKYTIYFVHFLCFALEFVFEIKCFNPALR